jgi:uncharacterized membrane protein
MWWGAALGAWLISDGERYLCRPIALHLKPLALIGRWSLSYYMLHQPVMIGALMALAWLVK